MVPMNQNSYLADYRLPAMTFDGNTDALPMITPIWKALRAGNYAEALVMAQDVRATSRLSVEAEAALLVGMAAAELSLGATMPARRHAGRSLDLFPQQWAGHRILLSVLAGKKDYAAAYMHMARQIHQGPTPLWDEQLSVQERQVSMAAWAWMLGDWEMVSEHLMQAWPNGIADMPVPVQEDWFRLSLYRDRPEDAAAVAALLIEQASEHNTDALLQTIVQNGWTKEALPLYRTAYGNAPKSQLLRRRLVALCIREGALEEARALTRPGALGIAA